MPVTFKEVGCSQTDYGVVMHKIGLPSSSGLVQCGDCKTKSSLRLNCSYYSPYIQVDHRLLETRGVGDILGIVHG